MIQDDDLFRVKWGRSLSDVKISSNLISSGQREALTLVDLHPSPVLSTSPPLPSSQTI
jgi:hypothetical protein